MGWSPPAPLSMGFPRQEYWSQSPFPSPGDLPDPGTEPACLALQVGSLFSEQQEPQYTPQSCSHILSNSHLLSLSLTLPFLILYLFRLSQPLLRLPGKESSCNAGDLGSVPGLGRSPGGGHGKPLQYSSLENSHGQRSLVGYSPWGHKESDMIEQLSTAQQQPLLASDPESVATYLFLDKRTAHCLSSMTLGTDGLPSRPALNEWQGKWCAKAEMCW